jgi:predicted nucleic acid-binding Zn ribbon protein
MPSLSNAGENCGREFLVFTAWINSSPRTSHDRNGGQMKQRTLVRKMIVRRTIFYNNLTSLTYLGGGSLDLH